MNRQRPPQFSGPTGAVEVRLAARLAGALSVHTQALPHDLSERLRFGREKALARARELRPASVVAGASPQGVAVLAGRPAWWQPAASLLPLVVLVAGLVFIDRWVTREQVLTAAEIDAHLLADDLPPDAFTDPGFVEFLRSPPSPKP